ncbi:MAG TPA: bifunctional nuclease family protein [Gemmatimonadaceae bacterium]|nr:bifunctional nuclease family protein [Gemmatimonadaceae bacterium]
MIEVTVEKLGLDSSTNSYVVILREKDGSRLLPIWIGQPEAESIMMEIKGVRPPRPLTHDLCKRLITGLGGSLRRVQITQVKENTYFAELHINRGDETIQVDARPSDSIAIALRLETPIFAQESLLTDLALQEADEDEEESFSAEITPVEGDTEGRELRMTGEELKEYLRRMRPEDFGKFNP